MTSTLRRSTALAALAAGLALVPAAPASAAKVTSLGPWKKGNRYLATADLDGRKKPRLNPVAKVDHVRAGQWIRIQCQVVGRPAYGSKVWIKTRGLYVPDRYVKTYTDGFLAGVPHCGSHDATPSIPAGPSRKTLARAVRKVAFERVYGSNFRIFKERFPTQINWDNNGCSVPVAILEADRVPLPATVTIGKAAGYYSGLFEKSCDRHDFGYRNYGDNSGGLVLDPSSARRERIDNRFHRNMDVQCRHYFGRKYLEAAQRTLCYRVADAFFRAVRVGGADRF